MPPTMIAMWPRRAMSRKDGERVPTEVGRGEAIIRGDEVETVVGMRARSSAPTLAVPMSMPR